MRKVIILGATGSIGQTAIRTIREKKLPFEVKALVAKSSESIERDASYFKCPCILTENKSISEIKAFLSSIDADIALNGISGSDGLIYSDMLIDLGFDIALANKETVVLGGEYIFKKAEEKNVRIIPVDSEHSAIYSLINAHGRKNVQRLIITASGGPFAERKDLSTVTLDQALSHPTWKMGKKITIDSATLANKGLEVIEAGYLFNFNADEIDVTIHRQSVVHSLIKTYSGAIYAEMSMPDMALPIIRAIAGGKIELNDIVRPLDFKSLTLTFEKWDETRFPLLSLAYRALKEKNAYPIAFNISDEVAVNAFISGRISFIDIASVVRHVMDRDYSEKITCSEDALLSISRAEKEARNYIEKCL